MIDRNDIRHLLNDPGDPKVSILMPAHRAGAETSQDPIRFEGLVRAASEEMTTIGVDRATARSISQALRGVGRASGFWRKQSEGLAVYARPGAVWSHAVPITLDETMVVGADFHLYPLLRVAEAPLFYVLALSRAGAQLFEATTYAMEEMQLENAPSDFGEITKYYKPTKQLQFRQASTAGRSSQVAMFHGHGLGEGRDQELILQYLRAIDRSVHLALPDAAPLLAVGVGELPGLFRQISGYPDVKILEANPDGMNTEALHSRAVTLMSVALASPIDAAVDRFSQMAGTGKASTTISEVVTAAAAGRIDSLIVADGSHEWGSFHLEANKVEPHASRYPGDVDLINVAAVHTMRHGGRVLVAGAERQHLPVAALFRF